MKNYLLIIIACALWSADLCAQQSPLADKGAIAWKPFTIPSTQKQGYGYFKNRDTGWVSVNDSLLYKTTDAGISWAQIGPTTLHGKPCFVSDSIGYSFDRSRHVVRTTDGGQIWKAQRYAQINSFRAWNEDTVYCVAFQVCAASTNGGAFWNPTGVPAGGFNDVAIQSGQVALAVGNEATWDDFPKKSTSSVAYTTDCGSTWKRTEGLPNFDFYCVAAVPGKHQFIAGGLGIWKTEDFGETWQNILSQLNGRLPRIEEIVFKDGVGLAAGYKGCVGLSRDSGKTWQDVSVDTLVHIVNCQIAESNTFYLFGSKNFVSTNSGSSWVALPSKAPIDVQVSPQPATSTCVLTVSNTSTSSIKLSLFDAAGRELNDRVSGLPSPRQDRLEFHLDLSGLPSGPIYYKILSDQIETSGKILHIN